MTRSVSKNLLDELQDRLPEIAEGVYETFSEEEDFIDIAVRQLDKIQCSTRNQSVRIQTKEMHQSPIMVYNSPNFVSDTDPELADILYIANFFESGQVVERRASLAQAKFASGDFDEKNDREWHIQMHQYKLLESMEDIEFKWKGADDTFTLSNYNKTFTTYIFASDFLPPFFQSVHRMKSRLYTHFEDPTDFTLPCKNPWGKEEYETRISDFLQGNYGQPFERGSEIYEFIDYMFSHQRPATFTKSRTDNDIIDESGDPVTDGGEEQPGRDMTVVFFDVSLDSDVFGRDGPENPDYEIEGIDELGRSELDSLN